MLKATNLRQSRVFCTNAVGDVGDIYKVCSVSFFLNVLFKFQIRSTFKGVLVRFHEISVRFANSYTLIITSSIPHYSLSS